STPGAAYSAVGARATGAEATGAAVIPATCLSAHWDCRCRRRTAQTTVTCITTTATTTVTTGAQTATATAIATVRSSTAWTSSATTRPGGRCRRRRAPRMIRETSPTTRGCTSTTGRGARQPEDGWGARGVTGGRDR